MKQWSGTYVSVGNAANPFADTKLSLFKNLEQIQ
jgi:hypothetical protein